MSYVKNTLPQHRTQQKKFQQAQADICVLENQIMELENHKELLLEHIKNTVNQKEKAKLRKIVFDKISLSNSLKKCLQQHIFIVNNKLEIFKQNEQASLDYFV